MSDKNLERIKMITDKDFIGNRDINAHIESCRISLNIIKEIEDTITVLREMLDKRDEEVRKLGEENHKLKREKLMITVSKDNEINGLKEVLTEQYKLIDTFTNK